MSLNKIEHSKTDKPETRELILNYTKKIRSFIEKIRDHNEFIHDDVDNETSIDEQPDFLNLQMDEIPLPLLPIIKTLLAFVNDDANIHYILNRIPWKKENLTSSNLLSSLIEGYTKPEEIKNNSPQHLVKSTLLEFAQDCNQITRFLMKLSINPLAMITGHKTQVLKRYMEEHTKDFEFISWKCSKSDSWLVVKYLLLIMTHTFESVPEIRASLDIVKDSAIILSTQCLFSADPNFQTLEPSSNKEIQKKEIISKIFSLNKNGKNKKIIFVP